jgi:hypothetical protein
MKPLAFRCGGKFELAPARRAHAGMGGMGFMLVRRRNTATAAHRPSTARSAMSSGLLNGLLEVCLLRLPGGRGGVREHIDLRRTG